MVLFEAIPNVGNLSLEKVLFEFDKEPIVFICLDEKSKRYLCLCTDNIIGYSWMITQIESEILIKLIQDEFSVYEAFEKSGNIIIMADKEEREIHYRECDFSSIPEDDLPDKNEKLENQFLQEYLLELKKSEGVCKLTKPLVFKCTFSDYWSNSERIKTGSSWNISVACVSPVFCLERKSDTKIKRSVWDIETGLRYYNHNDFMEDEFDEPKRDTKELIVCG